MLAYLNDVACDIKNFLFKQYCTSVYGSHLCTLFDREIEDLFGENSAKSLGLPYRTYCRSLLHVTDLWPVEVLFSKKNLKRFITGYCNKMEWSVLFLDHQCVMYLGLVIIFEMYVLKMILTNHSIHTVSKCEMNNNVIGKWSESVRDEDK